jgi:hypothetical protein
MYVPSLSDNSTKLTGRELEKDNLHIELDPSDGPHLGTALPRAVFWSMTRTSDN